MQSQHLHGNEDELKKQTFFIIAPLLVKNKNNRQGQHSGLLGIPSYGL